MSDNVLDVLTYMFGDLFEEVELEIGESAELSGDQLKARLSDAGFDETGIDNAFTWLENMASAEEGENKTPTPSVGSVRIYTTEEQLKLNNECRNFLLFMENSGHMNVMQREIVIQQAVSLGKGSVDLEDLKWVMMMVLGNSSNLDEVSAEQIESIVFADDNHIIQ
jgi:Smg protein